MLVGVLCFVAECPLAICICAEQTFSQSKTHYEDFSHAFEVAMEAYKNGEMNGKIENEIQANVKPHIKLSISPVIDRLLVGIIKANRLRRLLLPSYLHD